MTACVPSRDPSNRSRSQRTAALKPQAHIFALFGLLAGGCAVDGRDMAGGSEGGLDSTLGDAVTPNLTPDLGETGDLSDSGENPSTGGHTGDVDGDPTGPGHEQRCQHIDFLFVVDNSNSMADEQAALQRSVPGFIRAIETELDLQTFNLAVVTTEAYAHNSKDCRGLGDLVIASEAGDCGPYTSGRNFMTHRDNLDEAFVCAASLGIEGSPDEKPMEAMVTALGGDLNCNRGFLRDDALLVVTLISDEEDDHEVRDDGQVWGSSGEPSDWHAAVLKAKSGREKNAVALGLVGLERPNACPTGDLDPGQGSQNSPRVREFFEHFGTRGFVGDVCQSDYEPFFAEVMGVIKEACRDFDPPAR